MAVTAVVVASTVWAWVDLPNAGTGATFGSVSRLDNRGAAVGLGGAHPLLVLLAAVASTGPSSD